MQIEKLSNELQEGLSEAQSTAVVNEHNAIMPVHLILALLEKPNGTTKSLFSKTGFNLSGLKKGLVELIDALPRVKDNRGAISISPELSGRDAASNPELILDNLDFTLTMKRFRNC